VVIKAKVLTLFIPGMVIPQKPCSKVLALFEQLYMEWFRTKINLRRPNRDGGTYCE
jgi:hypothetical protein